MRLLADTHIVLWALADSPQLSSRAREYLQDPGNECWASSASVWEIAIKTLAGKHRLGIPLSRLGVAVEAAGFHPLDITSRHAAAIERISLPHGDPFDRLLLAQCEVETLRLLTADRALVDLPIALAC
ncbi:MAG TPA: type II toxin-antitoxin system VapC family toxin [Pseudomonadales bacterium]|nr:type II toxin-antitoxin system VapC family toxin [Pseudomonadales bacterium]